MLVENLKDGLERAREVVKILRSGKTAKLEEITGYPQDFLERVLIVRSYHDMFLFNYSDKATFLFDDEKLGWNSFLRVCRGVVFSSDGALLSFPFHKFFNINEYPETSQDNVAKWEIRSVTEKVDGVMLQIFEKDGELVFASRHGVWSKASILAYQLFHSDVKEHVWKRAAKVFDRFTLICEFIHPDVHLPGMIDYGDLKALVILAVRDLDTLGLYPAVELFSDAHFPENIFLPTQYQGDNFWVVYSMVKNCNIVDWEGVVLQGRAELGNLLVKIKNPHYLERVAFVKSLSPNKIIDAYTRDGWDGVNNLLGGLEEIAFSSTAIRRAYEALKEFERLTLLEIEANESKDVRDIPIYLRWIKTYEKDTPKWVKSFRNLVAKKTQDYLRKQEGCNA